MEKKMLVILICMLLITIPGLSEAGFIKSKNNIIDSQSYSQETLSHDLDWDYWSNSPHIYTIPSGNVGIGTINPSVKLDVEVNSGGAATIGSLHNSALGNFSIALGFGTKAFGNYSTSLGKYTNASGSSSTAMGWGTTASGSCSIAMGEDTIASGHFSTAIGRRIKVLGDYSIGIGLGTTTHTVTSDHVLSIMNGNVGIGTTDPNYLLDVSGDDDIVAQFSGRVKGADAISDDEFVTRGQVKKSLISDYIPVDSSDTTGSVGDISWDSDYFYVKTPDGWKRAALETWSTTD